MEKHYKTFFVLDASTNFRSTLCGEDFQMDIRGRSRPNLEQFAPISKPLYTCAIEAIYEYFRIVWDIFPNEKNIGLLTASDSDILPSSDALRLGQVTMNNYEELVKGVTEMNSNFKYEKNQASAVSCQHLEEGFKEALKRITPLLPRNENSNKENIRVIMISNILDENLIESLGKNCKKHFVNFYKDYEKQSGLSCPQLDVIFLNTFPLQIKFNFKHQDKPKSFNHSEYQFTHYPIRSGQNVISKIISLVLEHYELVSTTVMNIPMKEEQNAGSSTHYDVEMIHSKNAHFEFFNSSTNSGNELEERKRNDQTYQTLKLVWGLNRGNFQYEVLDTFRISALDLHMRPTICFINFFNSGKAVMLETNERRKTHLLQIHRGSIYIHVLRAAEKTMFDIAMPTPAAQVAQGASEEISDYLVDEFSSFIQQNQLVKAEDLSEESLQNLLMKRTEYFPMLARFSVFFSLPDRMNEFITLLSKPELSEDDLVAMKNFFLQQICTEGNLPVFSTLIDGGKLKKQEYFQILCDEFEKILATHCFSKKHQELLDTFIQLKSQFNIASTNNKNAQEFSNDFEMENRPTNKRRIEWSSVQKNSNKTLLQAFMEDFQRSHVPREEFAGRKKYGVKTARLYEDLKKPPPPQPPQPE